MTIDFPKLRPADQSSAAIRAALSRITAATDQANKAADRAKANRDALLLDGTPAELAKGRAALSDAKETLEQLEAMRDQLAVRLVEAERRELVQSVDDEAATADELAASFNAAWKRDFARLNGEMIALLQAANAAYLAGSFHQGSRARALIGDKVEETAFAPRKVHADAGGRSFHGSLYELSQLIREFPYV